MITNINTWVEELDGHIYVSVEELHKRDKEIERLNNIINEIERNIKQQITFCTNEADATINDKYCRIAINYLKHLKDKIKELKG